MLTFSLSGLRRGPHSALLDTGGDGHGLAGGRLSLGEPLTAGADFSAAQSNLAFLGMWIELNRVYQAELLPFDADAGSSSNMVSSQPGRLLGLQSWEIGAGELTFMVFVKRGAVAWSTSEYKIWYVSVWLFLEARHESPLPPGTPLSRTDFLRKGFLRDCRGRAYQPLQRDEPAQTRF